jgi:hypothetical protein
MKYIKKFENIYSNVNCYYKIIIDGSFDKFLVALEKLGIKDDFFKIGVYFVLMIYMMILKNILKTNQYVL